MERLIRHPAATVPGRTIVGLVSWVSVLVLAGLYVGLLASRGSFGRELIGLLLLGVVVLGLSVSPNVFVGLTLLLIGTYSLSEAHVLAFGGAQVYSLDVLLVVALLRSVLPRERVPPPARLRETTRLVLAIWALVMLVAAARAVLEGDRLVSVVRLSVPLLYSFGFYFGLGRIIRERGFELDKTAKNLFVVAVGLIAYMLFARATNTPFENETNPSIGHLGTVNTTVGVLRRDFGFASAFIVYPALGLGGAAYLLHSPRRTAVAAAAAGIGLLSTLLTLIRGEIFGLFLGLAAIALMSVPATAIRVSRATVFVASSFVLLIGGLGLWAASPPTARGVAERSLPGLVHQTASASATAKYRENAVHAGLAAAERHPAGVGLVPQEELTAKSGVDLGFIAHSGLTALLVYAGWAGAISAGLVLASLLRDSSQLPRPAPWLHPFFVGSMLMLTFYTVIGAAGLVGQGWVTALAALIAAMRFNAVESTS